MISLQNSEYVSTIITNKMLAIITNDTHPETIIDHYANQRLITEVKRVWAYISANPNDEMTIDLPWLLYDHGETYHFKYPLTYDKVSNWVCVHDGKLQVGNS